MAAGRDLSANRKVICKLAKNDFKTKLCRFLFRHYLGVYPAGRNSTGILVCIRRLAHSRRRQSRASPFCALWLISGIVPWFFFQEGLSGGTNALLEYNYLVKKVVFNIRILPVVKIIVSIVCSCIFCAVHRTCCICTVWILSGTVYAAGSVLTVLACFMLILGR